MLKIVIAEDTAIERDGLLNSIDWLSLGIEVVGAAEDGVEAWELIERYKPDIVLTDIKMPLKDGIELAKQVSEKHPMIKITFISGYEDFNFALEAIKSNVSAYILKPYRIQEITDAMKKVAKALFAGTNEAAGGEKTQAPIRRKQVGYAGKVLEKSGIWSD